MTLPDPRQARVFRFGARSLDTATGAVALHYAFDQGPELIERLWLPLSGPIPPERAGPIAAALELLHLIAGISYYKAGVPAQIEVKGAPPSPALAEFLDHLYLHGLGEFAYANGLDLAGRIQFPRGTVAAPLAPPLTLGNDRLVALGGGKDSLVSVELLRAGGLPQTLTWVGDSALIAACAEASGLPSAQVRRQLAPELFQLNQAGAYNGHIPVTAINSAILVLLALVRGSSGVVFSNEASASSGNLMHQGLEVNHQYSKSLDFETRFAELLASTVTPTLQYHSLLRPLSELAVTRRFAELTRYHGVFSSCNRNFRLLGARPETRWCGQCPKCRFVFLALAPFMAKTRLLSIFGRNLLDQSEQAEGFDALLEWQTHKPFECVGEGRESRAALAALTRRAEWREDALVRRFDRQIAPELDPAEWDLEALLRERGPHRLPPELAALVDAA